MFPPKKVIQQGQHLHIFQININKLNILNQIFKLFLILDSHC